MLKNKNSLNIGGKVTFAGARRYSPIDTLATIYEREYIEKSTLKNTQRYAPPRDASPIKPRAKNEAARAEEDYFYVGTGGVGGSCCT